MHFRAGRSELWISIFDFEERDRQELNAVNGANVRVCCESDNISK